MNKNIVSLTVQDYGSSILIFIQGKTAADTYGKWLSLANWGAIALNPEPNWITNVIASGWSTMAQLKKYLLTIRINELEDSGTAKYKGVKGGFLALAKERAEKDFAAITIETLRSVNSINVNYEFNESTYVYGESKAEAEKPDENAVEACYIAAMGIRADVV